MCGPERPPGTRSISTAIRATRYSARSGSTAISGSGARCIPESRPLLRSAKPHRRTRRELAAGPPRTLVRALVSVCRDALLALCEEPVSPFPDEALRSPVGDAMQRADTLDV